MRPNKHPHAHPRTARHFDRNRQFNKNFLSSRGDTLVTQGGDGKNGSSVQNQCIDKFRYNSSKTVEVSDTKLLVFCKQMDT